MDFRSSFLHTGGANKEVYVKLPFESNLKSTNLFQLETAIYKVVNAISKWQNPADELMSRLGLCQPHHIPKLFLKKGKGVLILLAAKIVDYIKATSFGNYPNEFL